MQQKICQEYLGEAWDNLPEDVIFDKRRVGCGGTTLALKSPDPYIILEPYVRTVENKHAQYSESLPVREGVSESEIRQYCDSHKPPKIISTYDSFRKVYYALSRKERKKFRLLVDEFHQFTLNYRARREAMIFILEKFREFKHFTFMTATPVSKEDLPEQLRSIKIVRQRWADNKRVANRQRQLSVCPIECNDVVSSVEMLIKLHLEGIVQGSLYVFFNSVKHIERIIEDLDLTEQNTRLICSKKAELGIDFPISDVGESPLRINLITSTAFEGADFYDVEGKTVIVTDADGYSQHKYIDPMTMIIQIAGRIRDTKYGDEPIRHLYKAKSKWKDYAKDQPIINEKEFDAEKRWAEITNSNFTESERKGTSRIIKDYLDYDNYSKKHIVDRNLLLSDNYHAKFMGHYASTEELEDAYRTAGLKVIRKISARHAQGRSFNEVNHLLEGAPKGRKFSSLRDWFLSYSRRDTKRQDIEKFIIREVEKDYPFFGEAIKKIGEDGLYRYGDDTAAIEKFVRGNEHCLQQRIAEALAYEPGSYQSNKNIKEDLKKVYEELKVKLSPKAKQIEDYFDVKVFRPIINGKQDNGYKVIGPKHWT